ncbi:MAG TPA: ATP-binding cassette domain-containing protein [Bdellovibrionota bacterium]|jgi:phospholipid/cholesterol/gamma-HCH transport system ATP-binding protein
MGETENILEIRNAKKRFKEKIVHDGLSISLRRGEILSLFGGSGTGKSVALRCVIGLERIDSGEILFGGRDISRLSETNLTDVRKRIAYVFQNGALFDSMTVKENLAYPLVEHTDLSDAQMEEKISAMLELIKMQGSENLLPASLSGGMQKRVGLARAIILEPEVILYDEPTAGLDPLNTKNLIEIMDKLRSHGRSAIFVTHDIPAALEVSDRIAILYNRKIHVIDTVDNIKKSEDPVVKAFIEGSVD